MTAVLLLLLVFVSVDPVTPERATAIREQAEQTVELVRSLEWCRHQRSVEGEEADRLRTFVRTVIEREPALAWEFCRTGPMVPLRDGTCFPLDVDGDWDVDMDDFGEMQRAEN